MSHQPPDREVVHLRQDLRAAQEVIQLLESENERHKQTVQSVRRDHQRELNAIAEGRSQVELKLREVESTVDGMKSENQRLRGEVNEAVEDRERQASLLKDVRLQVDGRLTRFVEALHAKDEELHRLQYLAQERERDRDRVQLLEKMLSSREENVNSLLTQLSTARTEHAEISAELRQKAALVDQQSRQLSTIREESVSGPAPSPSREERGGGGRGTNSNNNNDLLAVIPLYRQWSSTFNKETEDLEDTIDSILDAATDLRVTLEGGDPATLKQDRARLHSRRQLERERAQAHTGMLESASLNSDNTGLVQVHAIRANCDASRHSMTKIRDTLSYLKESLSTLQSKAATISDAFKQHHAGSAGGRDSTDDGSGNGGGVSAAAAAPVIVNNSSANASYWQSVAEERESRFRVAQEELYMTKEKAMAAESSLKASEHQITRQDMDLTSLRNEVTRLTTELSERQKAHHDSQEAHLNQLDTLRKKMSDAAAEYASGKATSSEHDRRVFSEASERWEVERAALKEQLIQGRMRIEELTQLERRSQLALEESRSKRQTLKSDHDQLEAEFSEMRTTYSTQNQELRQTQEVADSLAQELAHVKAVLEFETQQYEHRDVQGGRGGGGQQATDFDSWKKLKHRDPRSASSAAPRSSSSAPSRQVVIHRR